MNNQIHSGGNSASMPDSNDVFKVRRWVCYKQLLVSSTILLRELRREVPENLRKSEKNLFNSEASVCIACVQPPGATGKSAKGNERGNF
jgi:hypothetical protein